ncbi:MAG: restriction endonuclease subunit S [Thalassolituus sp.]|nr:MAG: restriction endonuclease subunit S [Thalassolituus sp.]
MGSEWKRVLISDVCDLIVDCVNKTAPVVEFETPFKMLRTPNVKGGRVSTDDCRYVTAETFEKWTRRSTVLRDDVLLTREAPLGEVGIVKSDESLFLGQRLMQYRANKEVLNPDFLAYSFLSPDLQHQFRMHEGSGSVVSHIRVGDCSKFELNIPPIDVQEKIANILSTLDQKIALNRQINTTLESMAQALFKSWFVDFDPVIDNALAAGHEIPDELAARAARRDALRQQTNKTTNKTTGATGAVSVEQGLPDTGLSDQRLPPEIQQLFPDRFVFTEEMGWVPEGWEVKTIGDVVNRFSVGKKFSQKTVFDSGEVPVLDQGKSGIIGFHNEKPGVLASPNDPIIVFANHTCYMRLVMHDFSAIQNVLPFKGKSVDVYWLFYGTLGKQQFNEYKGHWPDFVIHNLVLPKNHLDRVFGEYVSGMCKGIYERDIQNESLADLRDSLLPKLLSGQITLPDAEQQLAEVL